MDVVAELGALRARTDRQDTEIAALRDQLAAKDAEIRDLRGLGGAVGRLSKTVQRAAVLPAMDARKAQDDPEAEEMPPGVWSWASATRVERADRIREIGDWLHLVIRPRYPARTAGILACWAWHPTVVEELSWLYGCWLDVYASRNGTYAAAGDWHDRWADGALRRFVADQEFVDCETRHADQIAAATKDGWLAPTWQIYTAERRGAVWDAYARLGASGDPRYLDPAKAEEVASELLTDVGLDWDDITAQYIPEYIYCQRTAEADQARVAEAYELLHRRGDPRYGRVDLVPDVATQLAGPLGLNAQTVAGHLRAILARTAAPPPR